MMDAENNSIIIADTQIINPDLSKIKTGDTLKQKFKNISPKLKKIGPFLIVGFLCFILGIGTGNALSSNNYNKASRNAAVQKNLPGDDYNDAQGVRNNNRQGEHFNNGQVAKPNNNQGTPGLTN
jgi:hypothetical protein